MSYHLPSKPGKNQNKDKTKTSNIAKLKKNHRYRKNATSGKTYTWPSQKAGEIRL